MRFLSLEDKTGIAHAIVAPELYEAWHLTTTGLAQARHGTLHIKARAIERLDYAQLHPAGPTRLNADRSIPPGMSRRDEV